MAGSNAAQEVDKLLAGGASQPKTKKKKDPKFTPYGRYCESVMACGD